MRNKIKDFPQLRKVDESYVININGDSYRKALMRHRNFKNGKETIIQKLKHYDDDIEKLHKQKDDILLIHNEIKELKQKDDVDRNNKNKELVNLSHRIDKIESMLDNIMDTLDKLAKKIK